MKKVISPIAVLLGVALALVSCQTTNPYTGEVEASKLTQGSVVGGLLGAGVGALTGDSSTERRQRALIGAGIGALAGGGIGAYMDQQEAQLRAELRGTGVGIQRNGNRISLIMPGDVTFSTGSARISSQFFPTLASVAKVVNKYDRTLISIAGHTDNVGARSYNYGLSEDRARSVAGFLQRYRVNPARFRISAQGPDSPIASNSTAAGRQQNRRVEIQLAPLQR